MKKASAGIIGLLFFWSAGFAGEILDLFPARPGSLVCWTETRSAPRQLNIHYLKVSLTSPELEVLTMYGDDPDGDGPAESQLTEPAELFRTFRALAAVNANAYSGVGGDIVNLPFWRPGHPVDIHGLVVSGGKTISPAESARTPFWLDDRQRPYIGDPSAVGTGESTVEEAVADWFSPLVIDARIVADEADRALHPRTAIGFDDSGEWLLLVVVDGRRPGLSEGVTLYELAELLRARGCTQSINLDGGGSSIMLIREPGKEEARTVNSPSGNAHRPVPVMLGIRGSAVSPDGNPD